MLTVLGVDESIQSCGYAVLHGEEEILETHLELYKGLKSEDKQGRFLRYGANIKRLAEKYQVNMVILEQVRGYHVQVVEVLASLIAVALVATPKGVPVYTVNTSSWKKEMLGNGNLDKPYSLEKVAQLYGKNFSEDESEAILIARFGVTKYQWLLNLTKADKGRARRIA